jgi:hypothetical protein
MRSDKDVLFRDLSDEQDFQGYYSPKQLGANPAKDASVIINQKSIPSFLSSGSNYAT